ncbi:MAG: CHASE3 domain-containing protein [Candidatus Binatia bacterium]
MAHDLGTIPSGRGAAAWTAAELLEGGKRVAPPTRRIEAAFVVAIVVLLAVGFFTYRAIRSLSEVAALRNRTYLTSAALDDVLALVKDAESGQRGYLITGEYKYLEPYQTARSGMEKYFAKLRRLAAMDGLEDDRFDRLSELIDAKFLELAETIGLRRQRGFDAAAEATETDRGREIMDEIGGLVAEIRNESKNRLEVRDDELHRQVALAKVLTVTGSIVAFAYVFGASLLVRRDFTRRTRRQEDLFRRLIETAEAIILVRDREGRITLYNPYTERMSGVPLSEVRGQDWDATFVPEAERPRMREIFSCALRDGEEKAYVSSVITRDGKVRTIDWHTQVLRDGVGAIVGALSTGQDTTERRAAQKLAQERERLADIGAISAKLAHDLGNPLAAISLQAQAILRNVETGGEKPLRVVGKPVEQIASEVERLEGLIGELLAFAREKRLELERIDVPKLFRDVVERWHPLAAAHRIRLRTEIRESIERLDADESKLHRVLDNLVKNALEAIGEGPGEVTLSAAISDPERVRISVEDSGPGIADGVEVFRMFETTKENGTGLGLAVSKQIMLAHGGDLLFARREPHGTIFYMDLPRRGV